MPAALCCICIERTADIVFIPCGHIACCETCAASVMSANRPCPSCRAPIDQRFKTFFQGVPAEESEGGGAPQEAPRPLRAVNPALLLTLTPPAQSLGEGSYGRVLYGTYDLSLIHI